MRNLDDIRSDEYNNYVNCIISQFGVGSKTAAFYLGGTLYIITCADDGSNRVYECELSKEEMLRLYRLTGNAYDVPVQRRDRGQPEMSILLKKCQPQDRHQLALALKDEKDAEYTHFSHFAISVNNDEGNYIFDRVRGRHGLVSALADIYHRILHGPYGRVIDEQGRLTSHPLNAQAEFSSPHISLEYWSPSPSLCWSVDDLRDIKDNLQSRYMSQHKGAVFRCEVESPSPRVEGQASCMTKTRVEVFYYPCTWDGETHPRLVDAVEDDERRAEEQAAKERSASQRGRPLPPTDEGDAASRDRQRRAKHRRKFCSLYWNGRLIPMAESGLPYFIQQLPAELKDAVYRMHVVIFLAWPVLPDNVKLRFPQNMVEDWLNKKDEPDTGHVKTEYIVNGTTGNSKPLTTKSNTLKELFKKQVKQWTLLDANYRFKQEDYLPQVSDPEGYAHFRRVVLRENLSAEEAKRQGKESDEVALEQGRLVMINTVRQRNVVKPVFLRVLCIRKEHTTLSYCAGDKTADVGSKGFVIGYVEPKQLEALPPGDAHQFHHSQSLASLFDAECFRSLLPSQVDRLLAMRKVRVFSLRDVDKDISADELQRQYEKAVKDAKKEYPAKVRVLVPGNREVKDGPVAVQYRVGDVWPGSTVLALATENKPVSGEKVTLTISHLTASPPTPPPSSQAATGPASNRRSGGAIPKKKGQGAADVDQAAAGLLSSTSSSSTSSSSSSSLPTGAAPPPPISVLVKEFTSDVCSAQLAAQLLSNEVDADDQGVVGFQPYRFVQPGTYRVVYKLNHRYVDGDRDHVKPTTITIQVFPKPPRSAQLLKNSSGSDGAVVEMRLGVRMAQPLRFVLSDEDGRVINPSTMSGWKGRGELCPFTIRCPDLPDLVITSSALKPNTEHDCYEIGRLLAEPSRPSLGGVAVQLGLNAKVGQLVTCTFTFTPPPAPTTSSPPSPSSSTSSSSSSSPPPPLTFAVNLNVQLRPGQAVGVDWSTVPQEVISLANGGLFPDFRLQLIDASGQPTAFDDSPSPSNSSTQERLPQVSVRCDQALLPSWHQGQIAPQPMDDDGRLVSSVLDLPALVVLSSDLAEHSRLNPSEEGLFCDVHLSVSLPPHNHPPFERQCRVRIVPRERPSFILLSDRPERCDWEPLSLSITPGDRVLLCLHLMDELGLEQRLALSEEHVNDAVGEKGWNLLPALLRKAVVVEVSGLEDALDHTSPYRCELNDVLPDGLLTRLALPKRVAASVACEVQVLLDESKLDGQLEEHTMEEAQLADYNDLLDYLRSRLPFTASLTIKSKYGAAVRWHAEVPSSLQCGEPWRDTVKLFAVDKSGNQVPTPLDKPPPRVQITHKPDPIPLLQEEGRQLELSSSSSSSSPPEVREGEQDNAQSSTGVVARLSDMAGRLLGWGNSRSRAEGQHGDAAPMVEDDRNEWSADSNVVDLVNAVAVGQLPPSEGDETDDEDDVKMAQQWDHFLHPDAYFIMPIGRAVLRVSDNLNSLLPSVPISFQIDAGQATRACARLIDSDGKSTVLDSPAELKGGEPREGQPGLVVLPERFKFDRLAIDWKDVGGNNAVPTPQQKKEVVVGVEHGRLESFGHGGTTQAKVRITSTIRALYTEGTRSFFPPFVFIHTRDDEKGADTTEMKDEEERSAVLTIGCMKNVKEKHWTDEPLYSLPFKVCPLPFAVSHIKAEARFPPISRDEVMSHRHLLSEQWMTSVLAGPTKVVMAGSRPPTVEVALEFHGNHSIVPCSTLPPPQSSSLSLEWTVGGEVRHLAYEVPVYEEKGNTYIFHPKEPTDERKDGAEGITMESQGTGGAESTPLMTTVGQWQYRVVYVESRPQLTAVQMDDQSDKPTDAELVQEVRLSPRYPVALRLDRVTTGTPSVTNMGDANNRRVEKDLKLRVVDQYGGVVPFSHLSDGLLKALRGVGERYVAQPWIEAAAASSGSPPSAPSPQVSSVDRRPPSLTVVTPRVLPDDDCVLFPDVSVCMAEVSLVEEDEEQATADQPDDGDYLLVWSLPEPFTSFTTSIHFSFSNTKKAKDRRDREQKKKEKRRGDAKLAFERAEEAVKELNVRLQALSARKGVLESRSSQLSMKESGIIDKLRAVEAGLVALRLLPERRSSASSSSSSSSGLGNAGSTTSSAIQDVTLQLLRSWRSDLSTSKGPHPLVAVASKVEAMRAENRRQLSAALPVVRRDTPLTRIAATDSAHAPQLEESDGLYGQLASFISVDTADLCRLVSWHFKDLSNYYVKDHRCLAATTLKTNATTLDESASLQYEDSKLTRWVLPALPHLSLKAEDCSKIIGNPRYIFPLFHFHGAADNRARDEAVISHVVQGTMVMDNLAAAMAYRGLCSKAPGILCIKEMCYISSRSVERIGRGGTAPALKELIPRVGIRTNQRYEIEESLQAVSALVNEAIAEANQLDQEGTTLAREEQPLSQERLEALARQTATQLEWFGIQKQEREQESAERLQVASALLAASARQDHTLMRGKDITQGKRGRMGALSGSR